ncbi:hypothetical protein ANCDUO_25333, partial [Ancylostoma duodenale]
AFPQATGILAVTATAATPLRIVAKAAIIESLHGWAAAAEIAYFAYIYANVPKEKFKMSFF